MKKATLVLLFAVILGSCTGKDNIYFIHGSFKGSNSGTIYLISSGNVIDSVATTDGSFTFNGNAITPQLAYIADARSTRNARHSCMIVLEPGVLSVFPLEETNEYYVTGSKSNKLLTELSEKSVELTRYYNEHKDDEGVQDEVEAKYNQFLLDGVVGNPDNMYGLICLLELAYEQDPATTRVMLDVFTPDISKSDLWKQLDEHNTKMLATSAGHKYMEFSQADAYGNVIASKDVLATPGVKYVLIDFWASWCGPCMREVPYLKETYSKYFSKGFQILGVSLDRAKYPWMKAITDNQMNWVQVSDLKYWENAVAKQYGINSIPANFLVEAATGTIVATNIRGKDLEKKIAELLK